MRTSETDKAVRIHLVDPEGITLCGILRVSIADSDARTGWPDCADCIAKTMKP